MERYGPLVQRVCRRVLHNEHDVEDVFQATFLVLARRADGIAWSGSVGGWLSSVAHRLALGARSDLSRQHRREMAISGLLGGGGGSYLSAPETVLPDRFHPVGDPFVEIERRDLRGW